MNSSGNPYERMVERNRARADWATSRTSPL